MDDRKAGGRKQLLSEVIPPTVYDESGVELTRMAALRWIFPENDRR
jgi:hypothetical protein